MLYISNQKWKSEKNFLYKFVFTVCIIANKSFKWALKEKAWGPKDIKNWAKHKKQMEPNFHQCFQVSPTFQKRFCYDLYVSQVLFKFLYTLKGLRVILFECGKLQKYAGVESLFTVTLRIMKLLFLYCLYKIHTFTFVCNLYAIEFELSKSTNLCSSEGSFYGHESTDVICVCVYRLQR